MLLKDYQFIKNFKAMQQWSPNPATDQNHFGSFLEVGAQNGF